MVNWAYCCSANGFCALCLTTPLLTEENEDKRSNDEKPKQATYHATSNCAHILLLGGTRCCISATAECRELVVLIHKSRDQII